MKKSSHSKIKNTAIIFELLTRQIVVDTMNEQAEQSKAINIIKEFFNKRGILNKELVCYQALFSSHYDDIEKAKYLLEAVMQNRRKIDSHELKKAKYNLVKTIRENYDIKHFFKTSIPQYKLYAAIYRLFESMDVEVNPKELVDSRSLIYEHITQGLLNNTQSESLEEVLTQNDDLRKVIYKTTIKKFNEKYSSLTDKQKGLLKEYINSMVNTTKLTEYVITECNYIKTELVGLIPKIDNQVIAIKVKELTHILETVQQHRKVRDEDITALLMFYELITELKSVV